jgi:imidazole glycerol-phosphate synthase subunit HisF
MTSLRPRLIPCLQVADGELLKTRRFKDPVYLGDPINAVKIFNDLDCDELIVVDIRATLEGRAPDYALIEEFASEAFMPLTYGGGIDSVEQIRRILGIGIEKVVIGAAATDGKLIAAAADTFGSQSVVVSVDVRKTIFGRREVWIRSASRNTGVEPAAYALQMQEQGAGELFVQSVDLEGARSGYDLALMKDVSQAVRIPVIGCGGAGSLNDVRRLMHSSRIAAAAAGTMFVMHGKHGAPLISYPRAAEIASLLDTHEGLPH